jgi:hypothetical protein
MRRHYSYEHAVEVDYCSPMNLYWFEKDELEALQSCSRADHRRAAACAVPADASGRSAEAGGSMETSDRHRSPEDVPGRAVRQLCRRSPSSVWAPPCSSPWPRRPRSSRRGRSKALLASCPNGPSTSFRARRDAPRRGRVAWLVALLGARRTTRLRSSPRLAVPPMQGRRRRGDQARSYVVPRPAAPGGAQVSWAAPRAPTTGYRHAALPRQLRLGAGHSVGCRGVRGCRVGFADQGLDPDRVYCTRRSPRRAAPRSDGARWPGWSPPAARHDAAGTSARRRDAPI